MEIMLLWLNLFVKVWDLEKGILAHTHRWHTDITAFAIIQGTPFM
jgi:hypothetical protein